MISSYLAWLAQLPGGSSQLGSQHESHAVSTGTATNLLQNMVLLAQPDSKTRVLGMRRNELRILPGSKGLSKGSIGEARRG